MRIRSLVGAQQRLAGKTAPQTTEVFMPLFFWLPVIIFGGMWGLGASESVPTGAGERAPEIGDEAHEAPRQRR